MSINLAIEDDMKNDSNKAWFSSDYFFTLNEMKYIDVSKKYQVSEEQFRAKRRSDIPSFSCNNYKGSDIVEDHLLNKQFSLSFWSSVWLISSNDL